MTQVLSKAEFQEKLLCIMDQKDHFAYWQLMGPGATKAQLKTHYQQEWEVFVRDFPVFLARVYAHGPPKEVRQDLAENIFEEETGKLTLGSPHPDLFLNMMEGLGFQKTDFENVKLLANAKKYRSWLDEASWNSNWLIGAVVITIFVEGSRKDREEIEGTKPPELPVEEKLKHHPLVQYQGLDPKYLNLQRAHSEAEAGHRHAAWRMVLNYANNRSDQQAIISALQKSLDLWLDYRDEVAKACNIHVIEL